MGPQRKVLENQPQFPVFWPAEDLAVGGNLLRADQDRAFVGHQESRQKTKNRCLSAAGGTVNHEPLPILDLEGETADRGPIVIRLGDALKLDGTHAGLLQNRHAAPITLSGTSVSVTDSKHSAAMSSAEPLAIKVRVRAVRVSWPAGASKRGRLTSRKQKMKITVQDTSIVGRKRGASTKNTRRNHPAPATSAASSSDGGSWEKPANMVRIPSAAYCAT